MSLRSLKTFNDVDHVRYRPHVLQSVKQRKAHGNEQRKQAN